ncbi:hypothetical protein ABFX02_04G226900 [Erythranthe guttata]
MEAELLHSRICATHIDEVKMTSSTFRSSSSQPPRYILSFQFSLRSRFSLFELDENPPSRNRRLLHVLSHPTQVIYVVIDRNQQGKLEAQKLLADKLANWRVESNFRTSWINMAINAANSLHLSMPRLPDVVITIKFEATARSELIYDKTLLGDRLCTKLEKLIHEEEDCGRCCICQEDFTYRCTSSDLFTTMCNHQFHRECLVNWLTRGRDDCPHCRNVMNLLP